MIEGWTATQNFGVLRASIAGESYSKNRADVYPADPEPRLRGGV